MDGHPIEIADIRRIERDAEQLEAKKRGLNIQLKGNEEADDAKDETAQPERDPFELIHFLTNSREIATKLIEFVHVRRMYGVNRH